MTTGMQSDTVMGPKFDQLRDQVQQQMESLHVPGVAVGIFYEGQEYTGGWGTTNIENPLPVNADTLFQIGSTSKTFTGTVAMRLVEMGTLDLDAPVRTYLPALRLQSEDVAQRVTLRHLFTHTGGWIGDYFDDLGYGDDALAQIVVKMADLEQLTPLGEIWSYNNSGFYLAGRVIEAVTGSTYEDATRDMVLDPLGMDCSFFFPHDLMTYRFASGHTVEDDKIEIARPWALPRVAHAAGGITSTVKDQLKYARFHMGDGTAENGDRLLKPESIKLMQTPLVPAGSFADWVGITWYIRDIDGTRIVQHGGSTNGQMSAFIMVPERRFAITVLTNANVGGQLHAEVTKWALKNYLGLDEPARTPTAVSHAVLSEYAGQYVTPMMDLNLTLNEGELWLQLKPKGGFPTPDSPPGPTPPPARLAVFDEDRVVALDPPLKDGVGEFLRNPDGTIAWFRLGGRIARRRG